MTIESKDKQEIIEKLEKELGMEYKSTYRHGCYGYFRFNGCEKIYFNYYDGLYKVIIE